MARRLVAAALVLGVTSAWILPRAPEGGARAFALRSARESDEGLGRREALGLALVQALGLAAPSVARAEGELGRVIPAGDLLAAAAAAPTKRKIVITGANSGVGLEGAKLLAAAGHEVTCACRTLAKAEAAAAACGGGAKAAVCDLADLASVKAFAGTVDEVDTLVLNAGLALNTKDTVASRTKDGFELTIGTNHLGHMALYELLEAKLAKAPGQPRLVVTASPVHDPKSGGGDVGSKATLGDLKGLGSVTFDMVDGGAFDADKAYKDSKLCNILFTAEASRRLRKLNPRATANAFSPGLIPAPDGFFKYQNKLFASTFNKIANAVGVAETAKFGGSCLAFMATSPSLDAVTDGWYDTDPPGKHQLRAHQPSDEARDVDEQKKLWALSDALIKEAQKKA